MEGPRKSLRHFLETPSGRYLAHCEKRFFAEALPAISGNVVVQIGLPELDALSQSEAPWQYLASSWAHPRAHLLCLPEYLPFFAKSVDIVIAPHALEGSTNPHQVLREIERILVPEGLLLLSGINAMSVWRFKKKAMPWQGSFMSLPRLKDWLKLMNFECIQGTMAAYVPPFSSDKMIRQFTWLDKAGARWWPLQGGLYFLLAKKRVPAMIPIRLATSRWRAAPKAGKLISIQERDWHG